MILKKCLCSFLLLMGCTIQAQNLQLHFDPRHGLRSNDFGTNYFTATFEMYKPDKWGSSFMFIDYDFTFKNKHTGSAYAEISRDIRIKNYALMPHIEYNGGLGINQSDNVIEGYSIPNAWLAGASYPFQIGKVFMGTYLAYKLNCFEKKSHDVQWTVTWNYTSMNGKYSFSGFMDLWTENKNPSKHPGESGKKVLFLSEPQAWYNVTENLSFGTEWEVSYNFLNTYSGSHFYLNPTIATKWTF